MDNLNQLQFDQEQSLLGCLIKNNDSFDDINLTNECFYFKDNQTVFKAISDMLGNNKPVDIILLAERLEKEIELSYIGQLVQAACSPKNAKYYADKILNSHKMRLLQTVVNNLNDSIASKKDIDEVIEEAESGLFNILENKEQSNLCEYKEAIYEAIEWEDQEFKGHSTGLRDLDRLTGGFGNSNLIIIAGRPSMGKSSLAVQILEHVAIKEQVVFFSLEMSRREVATRSIKYHANRVGKSEAIAHTTSLKIHIDDKSGITIPYMRSQCRKIKRKHGLSMIVVDYLQLMTGEGENRNHEIGYLSRSLKGLAKEFNVPVVALSQLSRRVDDRSDKKPLMSDLRDSGEIEQDADVILFVYREEAYDKETENKGIAELICRKNRNGSIGEVVTQFKGEYTRFEDYNGPPILKVVKSKLKGFVI